MQSSNPVLTRGRGFAAMNPNNTDSLEAAYAAPSAGGVSTGRMTIEDVVMRTGTLFLVLVAVGSVAYGANNGGLAAIGIFGGFILAMVNSFKKSVSPALVIAYAAFEGLALGGISRYYNDIYPGIVSQAVLGTLCAFGGILFAYRSGKIRVTPKFTRIMIGALVGYMVFGLITLFTGFPGGSTGTLIAVAGVALATFFLVLDFDQIEKTIAAGAPRNESWRSAFGLMVTLVWLYLEVLRLVSILRNND
ncbi:unannotated protein [freshwater metagenome]|uniref:Unannotated protein n=1 Tax=freshwater metagenome TaxID=449393 RepID=A0A6J7DGD6_9ZZZZ|nr:hypothetical protein [Actinomycetota bacterium]